MKLLPGRSDKWGCLLIALPFVLLAAGIWFPEGPVPNRNTGVYHSRETCPRERGERKP